MSASSVFAVLSTGERSALSDSDIASDSESTDFKSSSIKSEDKELVLSTESTPTRLDESILFKSLSFISSAEIRLILKNNINAKISVNFILFDIFTPPF